MEQPTSTPRLDSACPSVIPTAPMGFSACGAVMTCPVLSRTGNNGKTLWIGQWSLSVTVSQKSGSAQHLWVEFEGSQHRPPAQGPLLPQVPFNHDDFLG